MWRFIFWFALCFSASASSYAAIDVHEFESEVQRVRYQSFIDEMRCPKCQNQSLSGSDSPIAMDLRNEIYLLIKEGKSDKEVVDYMVARYGEYILYKPRISALTMLLWFGPVILFIGAIIVLLLIARQRRKTIAVDLGGDLSEQERKQLNAILGASHTRKAEESHRE